MITSAPGAPPDPAGEPFGRLLSFHRAGPTVLRVVVGAHLRRLREAKGISAVDAAYAIRATHSKISRMELGRVSFRPRDIEQLTSALYLDRRADVDSCYAVMERLCLQAAPATDTVTMLKEIRAKL